MQLGPDDFQIGQEICIVGHTFHICGCDRSLHLTPKSRTPRIHGRVLAEVKDRLLPPFGSTRAFATFCLERGGEPAPQSGRFLCSGP